MKDIISMVNIYINDFLLALNIIIILKALKKFLFKKYNIKDLDKVKTIIEWQIYLDFIAKTIKIDQSVFILDLVIKERLTKYNANILLIKAGFIIEIT